MAKKVQGSSPKRDKEGFSYSSNGKWSSWVNPSFQETNKTTTNTVWSIDNNPARGFLGRPSLNSRTKTTTKRTLVPKNKK